MDHVNRQIAGYVICTCVEERYAGDFSSLVIQLIGCVDLLRQRVLIGRISREIGISGSGITYDYTCHFLEIRHIFKISRHGNLYCGKVGNHFAILCPVVEHIAFVWRCGKVDGLAVEVKTFMCATHRATLFRICRHRQCIFIIRDTEDDLVFLRHERTCVTRRAIRVKIRA